MSAKDSHNMELLSLVIPHIKHFSSLNKNLVHETWINISKYYNLVYPAIKTVGSIGSTIDVTTELFYYEADKEHNPEKEIKFTSLHTQSWAVNLGQMGAYLSPIYFKKRFIGVFGVSITANKLDQIFKEMSLPFNTYAILLDEKNNILVSSDEERSSEDFEVTSFYENHLSAKRGEGSFSLEKIDEDLFNSDKHTVLSRSIKGTNYKVLFIAENKDIYGEVETQYAEMRQIYVFIAIGIALFYVIYFLIMFRSIKSLAIKISKPLKKMVKFSKSLGSVNSNTLDFSDIEELEALSTSFKKTNKRLIELINYDTTTGLFNHRKLREDLTNCKNPTLILFHLENFKKYYNLFGPEVGKKILLEMAKRIQNRAKEEGTLYRENKDTLALLVNLNQEKNTNYLKVLSEQIVQDISQKTMLIKGIDITLSIKVGATIGIIDDTIDILAQADIALSHALSSRSEFVSYFQVSNAKEIYKENILWSKHTKDALDDCRIVAFFQPIFSYKSNKVEKFEALVRMILDGQIISPFKFLDAAKSIGKLHDITRVMVNQVFIMSIKHPTIEFSINTSFEDFEGGKLLNFVKEKLKDYKISPNKIIFEILETDTFTDENFIVDTIKELKNLGFKIAIDDFGTGHSNFSHITLMDVDFIKIDGMFIKDLETNELNKKMVKTMVSFAKEIKAKTIAEFVHNEPVFDIANELGIDYAQGYYKSPPISEEEVLKLLKK